MNAPKTPKTSSKKKQMTEKQAANLMTKRRACIQKFRETIKNKSKLGVNKSSKKNTHKDISIGQSAEAPIAKSKKKPKKVVEEDISMEEAEKAPIAKKKRKSKALPKATQTEETM